MATVYCTVLQITDKKRIHGCLANSFYRCDVQQVCGLLFGNWAGSINCIRNWGGGGGGSVVSKVFTVAITNNKVDQYL